MKFSRLILRCNLVQFVFEDVGFPLWGKTGQISLYSTWELVSHADFKKICIVPNQNFFPQWWQKLLEKTIGLIVLSQLDVWVEGRKLSTPNGNVSGCAALWSYRDLPFYLSFIAEGAHHTHSPCDPATHSLLLSHSFPHLHMHTLKAVFSSNPGCSNPNPCAAHSKPQCGPWQDPLHLAYRQAL